ncbi:hypothetical protein [Nocardia heshunensis]
MPGELDARLAAAAIIAVRRDLSEANWQAIVAGTSVAQRHPVAVTEAERAFDLLATGFERAAH